MRQSGEERAGKVTRGSVQRVLVMAEKVGKKLVNLAETGNSGNSTRLAMEFQRQEENAMVQVQPEGSMEGECSQERLKEAAQGGRARNNKGKSGQEEWEEASTNPTWCDKVLDSSTWVWGREVEQGIRTRE